MKENRVRTTEKGAGVALVDFRKSFDLIDHAIVCLIAERMRVVQKVGAYKKEHSIAPLDSARWQQVLDKKRAQAEQHEVSAELIVNIYNMLHDHALEIEESI